MLGPGLHRWDIALRRQFTILEGVQLRLQADFFNAFNRANFNGIDTNYGGLVSATDPATGAVTFRPSDLAFGTVTGVNTARDIQLGFKLVF